MTYSCCLFTSSQTKVRSHYINCLSSLFLFIYNFNCDCLKGNDNKAHSDAHSYLFTSTKTLTRLYFIIYRVYEAKTIMDIYANILILYLPVHMTT